MDQLSDDVKTEDITALPTDRYSTTNRLVLYYQQTGTLLPTDRYWTTNRRVLYYQ